MIEFDPTQISIEVVLLKSITLALGGAIQTIDEEKTVGRKEFYKRVKVPLSVARAFVKKHQKISKYLKPVYTAVIRYENRVIALERHPLGTMGELMSEGLDGTLRTWIPSSQSNLDQLVFPLLHNSFRQWYFDGRFVFSFVNQDVDAMVLDGVKMTADGHFRKVVSMTIDLQELSNADKLQPQERSCLAFISETGDYAISPPIWKDVSAIGGSKEGMGAQYSYDKTDENMSVNLNFALKAGKEVGQMFGYEYVEPLQLPRLMIELHTVNIPNIPKQIKATYDIGLRFTHAMAWLLGLSKKANTLDTYVMMRSLMKYLTQKGIYHNNTFSATNVFMENQSILDVPLLDLDTLMKDQDYTKISMAAIIEQARASSSRRAREQIVGHLAGLVAE